MFQPEGVQAQRSASRRQRTSAAKAKRSDGTPPAGQAAGPAPQAPRLAAKEHDTVRSPSLFHGTQRVKAGREKERRRA